MGNTNSRGSRKFLDAEPVWQEYYVAEWRSERSRELDRHGGPGRPPVARGDSITAKLVFLESALKHEQKRMKHVLQVLDDDTQKREQQQAQKAPHERLPDFILNTDFRAYERRRTEEEAEQEGAGPQQQQQRDFSLLAKDPELRRKMMEQRRKMLDYGKRVNVVKGAPGISKPLNLPAIKSKVAATWKPEEQVPQGDDEEGGGEPNLWASPQPAEWRPRMHQARRRLILLVGAIARWQLALSRRPGPKRLPRVNSFSYFIPQVLGAEAKRFIEEATVIARIKADAIKLEEPAAEPGLERVPADLSPQTHYHRKQPQKHQPQQLTAEAAQPAAVSERLRRDRGPPRRGVSDSGCPTVAAAAAGAVASIDAGGAGDTARPKRKPELRKSLSGKCSSSSSLPEALIPGHTSDVESYAPPCRLDSSRVTSTSTHLPAIGTSRISTSGAAAGGAAAAAAAASGGDFSSPPMVPRQPRAKLGRISSSGHHSGGSSGGSGVRTRRQSDSSLALARAAAAAVAAGPLPPPTVPAAAAAAGPAPMVGGGAPTVAHRRVSAVATVRSGPAWRSRGSDCGSMQRQRELSEVGGGCVGGGGSLLGGGRVSLSGGVPSPAQAPSPRRSDNGMMAPPDISNVGGGGGGFLPRITSSNGVSSGGGQGSSPPPKPMSSAQARRLALLAEGPGMAGADEGAAGRGATTSPASPSPLGRLKLGGGGSGNSLGSGALRSPDKSGSIAPATVAGGGGGGGGSILDGLCRDGIPTAAAAALASPLSAGVMKELREAVGLANGGGGGGGGVPGARFSPINSPGMRTRTFSMDASLLGPTTTAPVPAAAAAVAAVSGLGSPAPSGSSSPHPQHPTCTTTTTTTGPAPPSGAASPLPASPRMALNPDTPPASSPSPSNPPASSLSPAPGANDGADDASPVSPSAAPLLLPAPPPSQPHRRSPRNAATAAAAASAASASSSSSSPSAAAAAAATSPAVAALPSAAASTPASTNSSSGGGATADASSNFSMTTSSTTSSSSSANIIASTTTSTASTTTSSAAVAATAAGASSSAVPAASLPPLPSSKPPLGPAGTGERVRSARSYSPSSTLSNTAATASSSSSPNPPLPSQPPPTGPSLQPATAAAATVAAPPPPPPSPPLALDPEASARLSKAQQLMGMYANRVNATWAESQQWVPPTVLSVPEQERFCASEAWVPYKVMVLRMLKAGAMGVHIEACADAVQLADGTSMDVWTSDPWNLAQRLRPGSLPMSERIEGVSLGGRVLQQLVLAVESLAGREAVNKLTVVLAINDDQRNAVVADIIRTRAYGLKPENLILTAQRKRCGYRYDRDEQAFLEDPATPAQVLGSGYSLCQLAWLGDAFSVTREGDLAMLMGRTLLERFAEQRVEWLVCRRARDLALLTAEGVLDLQHLAFSLYAVDRHSGNMVVQAAPAASLTIPRAYDSTLLALKPRKQASAAATAAGGGASSRVASIAANAAGVEGGGGAAGVVDLRAAELSSPVMVEALAAVRKQGGQDGWVGLQRYLLHVPTLHAMLNTLGIFRPKLSMTGDVARLSLDAPDITADRRVACVAVHARTSPAILTSPNEVDDLIPLLLAQDHSAAFRDIIAASNRAGRESVSAGGGGGGGGDASASAASSGGAAGVSAGGGSPSMVLMTTKPGIRILLFIAANEVTQLAVNLVLLMARPGRDVVHLVTVVHNSLQMPTGQALLLNYLKQISNAMIEAHSEVLVKGINGLLEVMEGAASRLAPNLVVMASAALTMTNLNTASVMGSVTLSVLKRLTLPVAVATSNSKNLVLTQRRTALRCMVLVDPTSRPALNFICSSCMEPMRGDKLVLAGHHPTRQMTTQQQQTQRRLIDNFGDIASSHRFHTPTKLQLDGPVDKALTGAVEDEAVHMVGLQVPLGTKGVPGHVLGLIRACRAGVLVFRDTA